MNLVTTNNNIPCIKKHFQDQILFDKSKHSARRRVPSYKEIRDTKSLLNSDFFVIGIRKGYWEKVKTGSFQQDQLLLRARNNVKVIYRCIEKQN